MAVRVPKELSVRDPVVVAPLAGLRYIPAVPPGWGRRRCGRGFSFIDEDGKLIRGRERNRLKQLAVPPAWADVWFAPAADAYLQATGFDAAGRKQYRYHEDYRELREARKFDRIRYFGRALPALRTHIAELLDSPPESKSLAVGAALGVIDAGLLRVGNERSSTKGHYGATTLTSDHLDEDGHVSLSYVGKGGKKRSAVIEDEQLGDILASLADTSAERLFTYTRDDGASNVITGSDLNEEIARVAGPSFSAKDFRTWGGSREALEARVDGLGTLGSVDAAADALGNTRTVARSSYVHPDILEASDDVIEGVWRRSRRSATMQRSDRCLAKLLKPR